MKKIHRSPFKIRWLYGLTAVIGLFLGTVELLVEAPEPKVLAKSVEAAGMHDEAAKTYPFFASPQRKQKIALGASIPNRAAYEILLKSWTDAGKPPIVVFLTSQTWKGREGKDPFSSRHFRLPQEKIIWPPSWEIGLSWDSFAGPSAQWKDEELRTRLQNERNEIAHLIGCASEEISYIWAPKFPHELQSFSILAKVSKQEGMRLVTAQKTIYLCNGTRDLAEKERALSEIQNGGMVILKLNGGVPSSCVTEELRALQSNWKIIPLRTLIFGEEIRVVPQ